ncbi:hypothetical protein SAMN02799624_02056 [Paenibacillus sp. UNC496MF]|uniref:hypothetical protein n=1 Tax=Paenibacillus sp. UNC496MF TaxID=1502753 RepID=UPI0008ED401E|nr:hypothetical protein [Paenibacillus sp. UNC496MF]SFI76013.1 hypothetical protein SAMN02799624_02056 [Paenibacillus sp. UNC496MF]
MTTFQSWLGLVILMLGSIAGIYVRNVTVIVLCVTIGLVLLSLATIAESAQGAYHRSLGLPMTRNQLRTILRQSPTYAFESGLFEAYPNADRAPGYPLLRLDGEYYVRVKLFYPYLRQEDTAYTFALPGRAPAVLDCEAYYRAGADLFEHDERVYVRLAALGLRLRVRGARAEL